MSRIVKSKYNGDLEITSRDGRKVLDSENANYSYGTAQDLWEKITSGLDTSRLRSVCVLGLGGGTIVSLLTGLQGMKAHITAVEIDPVIVQIADREFGIRSSSHLQIACMDAYDFMRTTRKKFDLLIIDISIDFTLPGAILSEPFWQYVSRSMRHQSMIIFNALDYSVELKPMRKVLADAGFKTTASRRINKTNNILKAVRF